MPASVGHTSKEYELELREIRGHLVAMGTRCERAVALAISAFLNRDVGLLAEVRAIDQRVNHDEIEIDDLAVRVLALRQPVAYDLRFVARTLKFVTDLERIADEAVNIAERSEILQTAPTLLPCFAIPRMGDVVTEMLRHALDSFIEGDVSRAQHVMRMDDEVDHFYRETIVAGQRWMAANPSQIPYAMCVTSTAKYLERIADHATNLAEHVVYLENGSDVRHRSQSQSTLIIPKL
jgi:phosphate transport system protein